MRETPVIIWGTQTAAEKFLDKEAAYNIVNADAETDAAGNFGTAMPIVNYTITAGELYANFSGLSICFDGRHENWATDIDITMNLDDDGTAIHKEYHFTNERAFAFFPISKTWSDDATISSLFVVINKAHRGNSTLKINAVKFGRAYEIADQYINALNISQSVDFSGVSAPYASLTATIYADGLDQILGIKQLLTVNTNRREIGEFYVESIDKTADKLYAIKAVDALGNLAAEKYAGAYFSGAQTASAAVSAIAGNYWTSYEPTAAYSPVGVIPESDKRSALLQIATAAGLYINSNHENLGVNSIALERVEISTNSNGVNRAQTFRGARVKYEATATKAVITSHSFTADNNGDIVIGNSRYKDTRTENAYTLGSGNENKKTISNATLITNAATLGNARTLLTSAARRTEIWTGEYIWGEGNEGRCGAVVRVPTSGGAYIYGNVRRADLAFSGASVKVSADVVAFARMDSTALWYDDEADVLEWSDDITDAAGVELFYNGEYIATPDGHTWAHPAAGNYFLIVRGPNGEFSAPSNVVNVAAYSEIASASPAYTIAVPSTALAYTAIKMLGGASFKWNQMATISTTAATGWTLSADGTKWSAELAAISAYNFNFTEKALNIVVGHKYWIYGVEKFNSTNRAAAIRFYEAPTGVLFNPIVAAAVDATHSATANGIIMTALRSTTQSKGYIYLNCGSTDTNVSVVFRPILVDLTAVFGVGNEPTSVTDDRVARLKVIAEAMPQYDSGSIKDSPVESVEAIKDGATISTYAIPSAIRALDGYGASAGSVYNYIDLEPTIYHNMKTITFNGSENWSLSSVTNGIANFYISTLGEKFRNTTIGALPRQITTIANTFDEGFYYSNSSTTFFRIKSTRAANVEQFKALLAASPMTFHYEATSGGTDYAARLYHRRVAQSSLSSIASSIGLSSTYPGSVYFTTGGVVRMKKKTENIIADKLTFTGVYNASTYAFGQMNVQTNGTYNCWINNGAITTADARTLMESIMLNYELATEQIIDITDLIDDAAVVVDADGAVRLNNAAKSEIPNRLLFRIPQ